MIKTKNGGNRGRGMGELGWGNNETKQMGNKEFTGGAR